MKISNIFKMKPVDSNCFRNRTCSYRRGYEDIKKTRFPQNSFGASSVEPNQTKLFISSELSGDEV